MFTITTGKGGSNSRLMAITKLSFIPCIQSLQAVRRITEHSIHICRSTPQRIAVGILATYKVLLQLAALVLAIHTQRVKVKGLDDSKYIIAAVYVSTLGLLLATVTHFVVIEYLHVHAVLFAISLGFSSTAILGLVFIPKVCMT